MRFIIYSQACGTFIGSTYGGPFFSGFSGSTFKNAADTFASIAEAQEYSARVLTGDDLPPDLQILAVQTDAEEATMDDCVAAGTAAWSHHIARLAIDPGCYSRPFSFVGWGHSMVIGPARSGKSVWLGIQPTCVDADRSDQKVIVETLAGLQDHE